MTGSIKAEGYTLVLQDGRAVAPLKAMYQAALRDLSRKMVDPSLNELEIRILRTWIDSAEAQYKVVALNSGAITGKPKSVVVSVEGAKRSFEVSVPHQSVVISRDPFEFNTVEGAELSKTPQPLDANAHEQAVKNAVKEALGSFHPLTPEEKK